ncbi:Cobyrinic acid ac-diamide synthase (plasmid) [Gloeothece citriformis PCC 7424]|uniref:Cobyrinic acid ac-diamide synthase n=1 Tax=Gloeothece citriformis (strain PCC 7424) TaxID=65393 RepID=B7KMP1_GLOC7|nr:ParA family protein [Gloeothece citriformis]ACK74063.1 Cobyrinic acid ac-diamide synthase [Gloeothece citriformis PCC 7424]
MSKIITLFNQSGGVGKTTLTMNLGYALATQHHKVLLIDLDPQASLTTFMGLEPTELEKTLYNALLEEESLPIHQELYKMALVPTNINLSVAELELVSAFNRESRLKEAVLPIKESYDYILIDCPPSLGLLSVLGLTAATHILVPIETEFKSYFGTGLLLSTIAKIRRHLNPNIQFAGFIPTKYDRRRSQHLRTYEQMCTELKPLGKVFWPIPDTTAFPDSTEERRPLALYKSKHPAVEVLFDIATELEKL